MLDNAHVSAKLVGGVCVARVRCPKIGDFEAPALRSDLEALAAKSGHRLVVDLQDVLLMGSSGIGTIISAKKFCDAGKGRLVLCNISDEIMGVLKISNLLKLFTIKPTLDDALGAVR